MTTLKLSPNASGAGSFTIAAPSTSSDFTLNLPSTLGTNNGSALVSTDASGNLGLGVTPDTWGAKVLQFANGVGYGTRTANGSAMMTQNAILDGSDIWKYKATAAATAYQQVGGVHYWSVAGSGTAGNTITGFNSAAMTLDASSVLSINNGTSNAAKFRVYRSTSDQNYLELRTNGGDSVIVANGITGANGSLVFARDANTGGFTESARIDSSGNLLVGTTSVFNACKVGIKASAASFNILSIGNTSATNGTFIGFLNSSDSTAGFIAQTGTTTVAYNTSSDYRLKEDIQPMTGALARVAALKPVTYKWKADGSDGEGFIAHELAEVCPHAVTGEKDAVDEDGNPQYQGIDTSFLVATLTAALQELNARVEAQAAEIAALKGAK